MVTIFFLCKFYINVQVKHELYILYIGKIIMFELYQITPPI